MECLYIAHVTLVVIVMRGSVFYPLFCMMVISGSYSVCLCVRAWSGNMLCQYASPMNWTLNVGEGDMGVVLGLKLQLCRRCPVLIWLGIGMLFVDMCI